MKFGVRECADVVFRAKGKQKIGNRTFYKNEPVIYFDTLTTSALEGAATTVYATGGRGGARLMGWDGERTVTFSMTDALISPEGLAILTGAGLIEATTAAPLYVHTTTQAVAEADGDNVIVKLPHVACWSHSGELEKLTGTGDYNFAGELYNAGADIFLMPLKDGQIYGEPVIPARGGVSYVMENSKPVATKIVCYPDGGRKLVPGEIVLVDYYIKMTGKVKQIDIEPDKFGGYFYIEASTLFRDETSGQDMPAEFIIPKAKVQSNFTFTMAGTGDPSTFDFTMDAFPDYTKFDGTKKVLASVQIVEDSDQDVNNDEDNEYRKHQEYDSSAATSDTADDDHRTMYSTNDVFGALLTTAGREATKAVPVVAKDDDAGEVTSIVYPHNNGASGNQ